MKLVVKRSRKSRVKNYFLKYDKSIIEIKRNTHALILRNVILDRLDINELFAEKYILFENAIFF